MYNILKENCQKKFGKMFKIREKGNLDKTV